MCIATLELSNIRVYRKATISLPEGIAVFFGPNGSGKTTLLESISVLSSLRSFRTANFQDLKRAGEEEGRISWRWEKGVTLALSLIDGKRDLRKNGKNVPGSRFIGQLPSVVLAPEHQALIFGAGEERRRYLDRLVFGQDAAYLVTLRSFERALRHKRALLMNSTLLSRYAQEVIPWNEKIADFGEEIRKKRRAMVEKLAPIAAETYAELSSEHAPIDIRYVATDRPLLEELSASTAKEHAAQRTLIGPQRDDLTIALRGLRVDRAASQGERSSLLLSLKLSEFSILEESLGKKPFLLLDDPGATLDLPRRERLFSRLRKSNAITYITTADHGLLNAAKTIGARVWKRYDEEIEGGFSVAKWGHS